MSWKKGGKSTSGNRKRPKASQRRPLNRLELEAPNNLNASTSAKKLKQSEDQYDIEMNQAFGYRIINFINVFSAISNNSVCKICNSKVKFTEIGKRGLGSK
ncbi:hypothetical protein HHI36_018717 [Cryptolaemus montrouzieri]|uniref:Uncharacterized protein n=1 Tax=Cryptolaemus montrouzieri TaxID=559131 RepID=A0ABD2P0S1_9CUCU